MIKWLTKISQMKAMPLPKEQDIPVEGPPGDKEIGNIMTEDTARQQESEYADLRYFRRGYQGVVYDLGNQVLKYTKDDQEAQRAFMLMQSPMSCTIKVLAVKLVQKEKPFIWSILLEKARDLDEHEYDLVDMMYNDLADHGSIQWEDQYEGFQHVFYAYGSMIHCLKQSGFSIYETHADNVGWVDGRMVLFDLGTHPQERMIG